MIIFSPTRRSELFFLIIIIVIVLVHRWVIPQTHVIHSDIFFLEAQLSGHIIAHCCEYFKKCGAKLSQLRTCEIFCFIRWEINFSRINFFSCFFKCYQSHKQCKAEFLVLNNFWFFDVNANFSAVIWIHSSCQGLSLNYMVRWEKVYQPWKPHLFELSRPEAWSDFLFLFFAAKHIEKEIFWDDKQRMMNCSEFSFFYCVWNWN